MTATILAFPGDYNDRTASDRQAWQFLCDADTEIRKVSGLAPPIVDHAEWCLGDECLVSDDGFAVHRRHVGSVERVTVAVEQVVDTDGTAAPVETVIDGARGEFVAADVRQLIRLLWEAHDLAGGAR